MAKRTKSSFKARLSKGLQGHAKDETTYDREFINLPPGISGGIAKLADAKIGEYARGQYQGEKFVYLAGVVLSPEEVTYAEKVWADGKVSTLKPRTVETRGQRTGLTLPLCDTKNQDGKETDLDEHISRMLNELRKLGGEEFTQDIDSEEALEAALAALVEAAPKFRFSTSASDPTEQWPNPRTWENWHGVKGVDQDRDYGEDNDGIVDATATEGEEEPPFEGAPSEGSGENLKELIDLANDEDAEAQTKLTEKAAEFGVNAEKVATWEEVVEQIETAQVRNYDGDKADTANDGDISWQDLGILADEGDEEAAEKLTEICEGLGIDINDYGPWVDAAEAAVAALC